MQFLVALSAGANDARRGPALLINDRTRRRSMVGSIVPKTSRALRRPIDFKGLTLRESDDKVPAEMTERVSPATPFGLLCLPGA
jgi:hypothetical protein